MNLGTNFAIFVLFFGVAVLQAVQTRNWPWVVFWAAIGLYFLWTDIRYKGQPYPPTHKIVVALVTALVIGVLAYLGLAYIG